jgi:type IV secretion system protein VirB1
VILELAVMLQLASEPACSAPGVPPENVVAVAQQESGRDPLALHDDTTGTSYHPPSVERAAAIASTLLAAGHSVGVGLMQLTPPARFGLSVREALDPCRNLRAGAELLARSYHAAIRAALSSYNCGGPNCAPDYVRRVEAISGRMPRISADVGRGDAIAMPPMQAEQAQPAKIGTPVFTGRTSARELVFTVNR